jgi:hypothetical protein
MRSPASSRTQLLAFLGLLRKFAPLRLALLVVSLLIVVLVPDPGTRAVYHGWEIVRTVIVPSLVPLAFMMLLLDAIMNRVQWVSASRAGRGPYRLGMALDLLLAAALVAAWLPYFLPRTAG